MRWKGCVAGFLASMSGLNRNSVPELRDAAGTALRCPCGGDGQKIRSRGEGAGGHPRRFPLRRRARAPPVRPLHSARWGDGSCRPGRPCGGPGPSACRAAPHPAAGHGSLPAASTCAPGKPFDGPRCPMPRSPVWSVRGALRCGSRTLVDAAPRTRCSVPGRPKRPSCGRGSPHPREGGALRASRQAEAGHPDVGERPGGRADQRIRLAGGRDPAPCGGVPRPLQRHARVRQMEHGCPGAALFDHGSPAWLTDLAPPVGPGHDRIRDAPGHRADRPTIRLSHRIAPELTTHHWGHRAPKEMRRR